MFTKRVITILWSVPILIAAIWFGTPWFTILAAVWGLLSTFEFYKMVTAAKVEPLTVFGLIWTVLFIIHRHFEYEFLTQILLSSAVIIPLIFVLVRRQKEDAFSVWAWTMAGIFYIGWLLSYFVALRILDDGRGWAFLALFTIFGSDTAAYLTGRVLGRHRLAPNISPRKTWEGAIGGILGGIILSLIITLACQLPISYWQAIILGIAVSIAGQVGDLVESLLKRNMGVKDSGRLLPGHGGFLDRTDSIVFAGIVVYYYVIWAVQ